MEETKVKTYRITLDFEAISNWRDEERDDLPVHGMVSFYKAAGIIDFFKTLKGNLFGCPLVFRFFITQTYVNMFAPKVLTIQRFNI